MRRLLLILWRIANYPVGLFGLIQMLEVTNREVAYDDFGNEYGVGLDFGSYVQFGLGLAVLLLAALSAGQNATMRHKQTRS
jgi:hypothetical protein